MKVKQTAEMFLARYRSHPADRPVRVAAETIEAINREIFAEAREVLPAAQYFKFERLWMEEGGVVPSGMSP